GSAALLPPRLGPTTRPAPSQRQMTASATCPSLPLSLQWRLLSGVRGPVSSGLVEANRVARAQLGGDPEIDGGEHGEHGIATRRGVAGAEEDRLTAGRHLQRAGDEALRLELAVARPAELRALESDPDAVRVGANPPSRGDQGGERVLDEPVGSRAG